MTDTQLSTMQICALIAMIEGSREIKRTADKPTAIKKFEAACIEKLGDDGRKVAARSLNSDFDGAKAIIATVKSGDPLPGSNGSKAETKTTPAAAKSKKPKADKAQGPGKRQSTMMGKTIRAIVERNTRRAETHGFKSLGIILANPGISVEEFVKKGGRLVDLRWDVNKGNVKLEA